MIFTYDSPLQRDRSVTFQLGRKLLCLPLLLLLVRETFHLLADLLEQRFRLRFIAGRRGIEVLSRELVQSFQRARQAEPKACKRTRAHS